MIHMKVLQRTCPKIIFDENTGVSEAQLKFLSNLFRKERLITELLNKFCDEKIEVFIADVLIVQTTIEKYYNCDTTDVRQVIIIAVEF